MAIFPRLVADRYVALSRADRELVEDTFRVTSLSLQNLQGAESIGPYISSDERRSWINLSITLGCSKERLNRE